MREKPLAFLALVKVLETAVGNQTGYNLLDPFPCVTLEEGKPAYLAIQRAGRVIAQPVGLNGLTFIVAVTAHQPDTAGHIELRYDSSEVFVEVSQDICSFKDAVLATLCHEIPHKFLHVHKIKHGFVQLEQELLTDVAAVYLGMGKIMLNGCECERTWSVATNGRTTTTTHKLKTGYMSCDCFAFVYRLICEMRKIPREKYMAGLSEPAREAVQTCEAQFGNWFRSDYHDFAGAQKLIEECEKLVQDHQERIADADKTIRTLERSLEDQRVTIRNAHVPLSEAAQEIIRLGEPRTNNPHLRYLEAVEIRESKHF